MLPRVVTDFLFNNQPDALIIQNLFCHKTLHVLGILSAHHQFSTVHMSLLYSQLTGSTNNLLMAHLQGRNM
jgi:hypothetical protein